MMNIRQCVLILILLSDSCKKLKPQVVFLGFFKKYLYDS